MRGLKRVSCLARWGVGYDRIDTAASTAADVLVALTPLAVRRPVAEGILAMILSLAKDLRALDRRVREGRWRDDLDCNSICIEGRTLGSVGGEARSLAAASTLDTQLGPIYTIETWIYPTALDTWGRLVLNWSGGQSYHFALRNDSRLSLFHNEAGGPNRNIDSDLGVVRLGSVAGWQHVVGVADGSQLRIYYNGQQVGSAPYDGTIQTLATGLGLGDTATGGSGTGLRYQGYLDDLAIWNVALTPQQIRSHFEAGGEGMGLDEIGADIDLAFDARATRDRPDAEALLPESIDITAHRDLLQLGNNVLAIQGLNSSAGDADFLIAPELEAATLSLDAQVRRYFSDPTPGGPNGTGTNDLGPAINEVTENPTPPADGDDLVITAAVRETNQAISNVELHYRVMFAGEVTVPMFDDGLHGDGEAGDDVYGAAIPATAARPGEMVRWFVTAGDRQSNDSRWPLFEDAAGSPQYFGTVVVDPQIVSDLPVLHRFVENPSAAETGSGTRASVFYTGEFYDNVFLRIRGGTSRSWPKKSYKIKFNEGHHFRFDVDQSRVDEINVNTTYTDKSYVRSQLVYEVQRDAGLPSSEVFPIRMEQNGAFFSVALFVEQPDKDFLRRYDLDTNGALYKGGPGSKFDGGTGTFVKQTRLDEDKSDLQAFINGLAQSGASLETFLFDNVDLPGQINFMATTALTQNIDASDKNHYVYRDTEGSGEWRMLPWDQDLTFGPDALNTDRIVVDQNSSGNRNAVHPFLGGRDFGLSGGKYNDFLDRIFDNPRTREMFLRRLRSLADEFLGTSYFQDRIDELVALLGPDVLLDKARWGGNAHFGGSDFTLVAANERIKNEFLALKYPYLTVFHNTGGVGIPDAQPTDVTLQFGAFDYHPASGNQDEEYIEIRNPHAFSVDASNWQITGGVRLTLPPGTVIGAGESIFVTPDAAAFRARSSGPSGGQNLFVVGGYRGHLSSRGEVLQLFDPMGREVDSFSYEGQPSEAQQFLRISELMFHPADDETGRDGDDFEYIELVNTGPAPLDLAGVHFTSGVQFTFTDVTLAPSQRLVLVKNTDAFAERYDTAGMIVAGPFTSGTLDNGGESVKLEDAQNATILEFRYDNNWHPIAAGLGFSISVIDVTADFDMWGDPAIWRPSSAVHGSPGVADSFVVDMVSVPAPGAIVVNEVLAHSDTPDGDWIELFNTTGADIDISGWFLSDNKIDPLKYEIPSDTIIAAGGFATFTESQHFGGLFALSELGDDVVLQAVRDEALIGFRAREDFGANENGVTLGRTIKSTGGKDFVAMQTATFGAANSEPLVGPVVIHEIMYHPGPDGSSSDSDTNGGGEFIELMNISGAPVVLEGWHFDAIAYTFGPGVMIQPGELIVVVPTEPEAFRVAHNLPPGVVFGPYTDKLDNDGESLRLNKPGDPEGEFIPSIMVDRVSYNDKPPWPVEADGTGAALQRITPEAYGNEPQNWGVTLPGGTPGDFFTLPTVNEVLVSASDWSPAMLARLSAAGLGEGGFSIPAGEDQLLTIAWTGIDRISIRFSEHVVVTSDDLRIAGVNMIEYSVIDFQYDGPTETVTTSTATWTLDRPVRADNLRIELSADVRDNSDFPVDGNWSDATSAFPSGNGVIDSGDVFQFRINVSPGDVTGDERVDRADLIDLIHHLG
ncbi:MAG: lamin tail domain-containing protein, partial [Planctomycetes bacterium]|nr:lamin tail domain-containing protein [Planctomycetota bacterium]